MLLLIKINTRGSLRKIVLAALVAILGLSAIAARVISQPPHSATTRTRNTRKSELARAEAEIQYYREKVKGEFVHFNHSHVHRC